MQVESGVVLAVEKRISSPLLIPSSLQKILEIDAHCGAASSGLAADASTLVEHARVEAQNHWYEEVDAPCIVILLSRMCSATHS